MANVYAANHTKLVRNLPDPCPDSFAESDSKMAHVGPPAPSRFGLLLPLPRHPLFVEPVSLATLQADLPCGMFGSEGAASDRAPNGEDINDVP
jgi:hypothetical protein